MQTQSREFDSRIHLVGGPVTNSGTAKACQYTVVHPVYAVVAQRTEQRIPNPCGAGSTPAGGTPNAGSVSIPGEINQGERN